MFSFLSCFGHSVSLHNKKTVTINMYIEANENEFINISLTCITENAYYYIGYKIIIDWAWPHIPLNPAFRRQRKADVSEIEASLVYIRLSQKQTTPLVSIHIPLTPCGTSTPPIELLFQPSTFSVFCFTDPQVLQY